MGARRTFTREFKMAVVRLARRRGQISAAARELGIDPDLIHRWRRRVARQRLREFGRPACRGQTRPNRSPQTRGPQAGWRAMAGRQKELAAANRRLAAENSRLKAAAAILRAACAARAFSPGAKFAFIRQHSRQWPVAAQCLALGVSRGGYYRARHRPPSKTARRRAMLLAEIRKVHRASRGTYGAPRIHQDLLARRLPCDKKTVAKLMRAAGLRGVPARTFRLCTTNSDHGGPVPPNQVGREFVPRAPNRLWLTDISYLSTGEGFLYLAVVEDMYSRRIVGWGASTTLAARLPASALARALRARLPAQRAAKRVRSRQAGTLTAGRLVVHSDRGVQFASGEFRKLLAAFNAVPSMSRRGNCWDNAPVESFFATLKRELGRRTYCTFAAARQSLRRYILGFYNARRRHSGLGYQSPAEHELQFFRKYGEPARPR